MNASGRFVYGEVRLARSPSPYQTFRGGVCVGGILGARATLASAIAHELLGHAAYQRRYSAVSGEFHAVLVQNLYHAAAGQRLRCGHSHLFR